MRNSVWEYCIHTVYSTVGRVANIREKKGRAARARSRPHRRGVQRARRCAGRGVADARATRGASPRGVAAGLWLVRVLSLPMPAGQAARVCIFLFHKDSPWLLQSWLEHYLVLFAAASCSRSG